LIEKCLSGKLTGFFIRMYWVDQYRLLSFTRFV